MCLSPQRKSGHEFCVQHTDPYSTALLHQPTSSLPAPSSLAVNLSFFTQTQAASFFFFYQWAWLAAGCLQREKCAWVSEKDRTSPWISAAGSHTNQENVCVCACLCASIVPGTALYELWWTLPCNKFNLTAGTGCNATTTPAPLPHTSWTLHQGSLYNCLHSFPCLCDTLGLCEVECQGVGS